MTLDEARLLAGVNGRAGRLFRDGYRANRRNDGTNGLGDTIQIVKIHSWEDYRTPQLVRNVVPANVDGDLAFRAINVNGIHPL